MNISKAAMGIIAAISVAAGAGGAWLATRPSEPPPMAAVTDAPLVSTDPSVVTVEQSEAFVSDVPAAPTPIPPARVERAPVRREAPRPAPAPVPPPAAPRPVPVAVEAPVAIAQPVAIAPPAIAPAPAPAAPVVEAAAWEPEFVELVIDTDSVIGLQVETSVSSETARVEDEVVARVTRDVRVGDRVAIPSGSRAYGEVTLVERGGRLRDQARLGIRFTSLVLVDGTRVPLQSDTVYREGDAPGGESAAKIGGGAIGGAIIGGILGGARGAAIGGSIGAGAGTAAVMTGGRNPATLETGTPVTIRVLEPATVTVER